MKNEPSVQKRVDKYLKLKKGIVSKKKNNGSQKTKPKYYDNYLLAALPITALLTAVAPQSLNPSMHKLSYTTM